MPDDPPPRRNRVQAVAGDVTRAGTAAFSRAGFTDPTLVLRWTEIAGPEVARIARPLKFSEGPSGGVLTLLAEPGAALFLGHDARSLTGRINAYLGRNAVTRIKFVQTTLAPPPAPVRPPKPLAAPDPQDPVHKYRGPDGLKNALQSLARWRAPRQER
ncbi:MAG TPA: DUF721 domain-containing protein [Rhizomicrobium sp.]|nr:DUF721 domain-containing protein [Rhizomicrobium sp.]